MKNKTLFIICAATVLFGGAFCKAQTIELTDDQQSSVKFIKSIDDRIIESEKINVPILKENTTKKIGTQDIIIYSYLGNEVAQNKTFFQNNSNISNIEVVDSHTIKEYFTNKYFKNDNGQVQEIITEATTPEIWNTTKLKTTAEQIISIIKTPYVSADTNITATNNKDTTLSAYYPTDSSLYANVALMINSAKYSGSNEDHRAIINFTLPNGSGTISDIKLFLYVTGETNISSYNINAHTLTTTGWAETDPNGACWNYYTGTTAWPSAGGDYTSTIIDHIARPTSINQWFTFGLLGSAADNPITKTWNDTVNLLLKASTEGLDATDADFNSFASKEYTSDTSKRPYIEITFTAEATTTPPTATSSIDHWPCSTPENWDLSIITGCKNIYNGTTSSSTISSVEFYYYYSPFILYIFVYTLVIITLSVIAIYFFITRHK